MTEIAEDNKKSTLFVLKSAYLAYESKRISNGRNKENDQISVNRDEHLFLSKKFNWFGRAVRRLFSKK